MTHHDHSPTLHKYRMSMRLKVICIALVALGLVSLRLLFVEAPTRAWYYVLIGAVFFLGFGLYGLFFTAIQHLTSAKWSVVVRRVMEAMALTLPAAVALFIPVVLGLHHIYEWTHEEVVQQDHLLHGKAPFLNEKFFLIRLIAYFVVWIGLTFILTRNSFKQDLNGDAALTKTNWRWSSLTIVLFAATCSLAGFDLLMSLEPHWFSTIFGVYFFAGLFQAGLAMTFVLAYILWRAGTLRGFMTVDHFHDLGRLIFGFSVFWAYIAFSQGMLIWYGDLPEETFFYRDRFSGTWACVSYVLLALRFGIPFLVLMPFGAKRNFKVSLGICAIVLLGQWVDLCWVAMPARRLIEGVEHVSPILDWKGATIALGFVSLFVLVVGLIMERLRMVPIKDPRLGASLHYYHH